MKNTKMEDFVKGMFHFFKNYQKSEMLENLEMVIIDKSLLRFVQILIKWSGYQTLISRGELRMVCRSNVYEPTFCPRKNLPGFPVAKKDGWGPYFHILGKCQIWRKKSATKILFKKSFSTLLPEVIFEKNDD